MKPGLAVHDTEGMDYSPLNSVDLSLCSPGTLASLEVEQGIEARQVAEAPVQAPTTPAPAAAVVTVTLPTIKTTPAPMPKVPQGGGFSLYAHDWPVVRAKRHSARAEGRARPL